MSIYYRIEICDLYFDITKNPFIGSVREPLLLLVLAMDHKIIVRKLPKEAIVAPLRQTSVSLTQKQNCDTNVLQKPTVFSRNILFSFLPNSRLNKSQAAFKPTNTPKHQWNQNTSCVFKMAELSYVFASLSKIIVISLSFPILQIFFWELQAWGHDMSWKVSMLYRCKGFSSLLITDYLWLPYSKNIILKYIPLVQLMFGGLYLEKIKHNENLHYY